MAVLFSVLPVGGQVTVSDYGATVPTIGANDTGHTGATNARWGWDADEGFTQSFTAPTAGTIDAIYIAYNGFNNGETLTLDLLVNGSSVATGILLDGNNFSGDAGSDDAGSPRYWMKFDLSSEDIPVIVGSNSFTMNATADTGTSWAFAPMYNNTGPYAGGALSFDFSGAGGDMGFVVVVSTTFPDDDMDGISDSYELANTNPPSTTGLDPALDDDNDGISNGREFLGQDAAGIEHGYGQTRANLPDTDSDGLDDHVEITGSANAAFGNESTDPTKADTDGDGIADGEEVMPGLDGLVMNPNQAQAVTRLLGIDFNRNDELGSPSQTFHRIIAGSASDASANPSVFTKTIGTVQVEVSRPDAQPFEFRGGNGDASRAIPGGDTSLSFLVADFIGTRDGRIDLTFTGLPAGNYLFRSSHLEPFTSAALGFAQGATATEPNTFDLHFGGTVRASVQPTALGSAGLNTTFINDSQIPQAAFAFNHDGNGPLTIELHAVESNGADRHLLLNGFELLQLDP